MSVPMFIDLIFDRASACILPSSVNPDTCNRINHQLVAVFPCFSSVGDLMETFCFLVMESAMVMVFLLARKECLAVCIFWYCCARGLLSGVCQYHSDRDT